MAEEDMPEEEDYEDDDAQYEGMQMMKMMKTTWREPFRKRS